jgi:hypothetical protein
MRRSGFGERTVVTAEPGHALLSSTDEGWLPIAGRVSALFPIRPNVSAKLAFHPPGCGNAIYRNLWRNMRKQSKQPNRPVHTVRVGAVSASVFLTDGREGEKFPSAIIRRSYKSESGFKESSSYGARHLNELATVVANLQNWMTANYPDAAA